MSDHDDLINVARRWQRLYNESQAEISRLMLANGLFTCENVGAGREACDSRPADGT